MRKALIYVRVSTAEQAKEGQSISAQIKLCRNFAQENNISIAKNGVYKDEGKSGSNTNRNGLQALLERISEDSSINLVLVLDTDRLARNTLDHLSLKSLFKKRKVDLISISQPMIDDSPEGNFIDVVLAGANALQSQITGRKTSKVMEQKIKAGWWAGSAPIGYINIDNQNPSNSFDRRIIVPDPKIKDLIKRIFDLYSTGKYNVETLTNKMNNLGLTSNQHKPVVNSLINRIIKNCFYYGDMKWKDKIYPGKHQPIIDKDTWETCQKIMDRHNNHASRKRIHDFLLRGFLFCDNCNSRYYGEKRKKNGNIYYHYFCSKCKGGTYTKMINLERQVERWFGKINMSEGYATELISVAKKEIESLRKINNSEKQIYINQKIAIENKIRIAEDNLLDKTLEKHQFKKIISRLENELKNVELEINKINKDYSNNFTNIQRLVEMATNIKRTYTEATKDLKRDYLNLFFEKFIVKNGKIVSAIPSKQLKPLIKSGKISVRVDDVWLPR